jgi:hypothetical protein
MPKPDDDPAVRDAAAELRETITLKLGELADRTLRRPRPGTAQWEAFFAERDTADGLAEAAEWHLTKLRIARVADVDATGSVIGARRRGATWKQIGAACGISRQAAHDRWSRYVDNLPPGDVDDAAARTDDEL